MTAPIPAEWITAVVAAITTEDARNWGYDHGFGPDDPETEAFAHVALAAALPLIVESIAAGFDARALQARINGALDPAGRDIDAVLAWECAARWIREHAAGRPSASVEPQSGPGGTPGSGPSERSPLGLSAAASALQSAFAGVGAALAAAGHTATPVPDHPHTDPGDGRTECQRCGKHIWPAIHSCKGIPVTDAARARAASRPATSPGGRPVTLRVVSRQRRAPLLDPGDEDLDPPGRAATSPTGDPTR